VTTGSGVGVAAGGRGVVGCGVGGGGGVGGTGVGAGVTNFATVTFVELQAAAVSRRVTEARVAAVARPKLRLMAEEPSTSLTWTRSLIMSS